MKKFFGAAGILIDIAAAVVIIFCVIDGWWITGDWTTVAGLGRLAVIGDPL